ncbi:leucine-rich repeat-containing G-protein coupled receptor 4 [Fopius arisanus]|nr:PREDICTED: leucine-rich repeat-containing G-protein coupled receptor 4-like [Fopius arisanus]
MDPLCVDLHRVSVQSLTESSTNWTSKSIDLYSCHPLADTPFSVNLTNMFNNFEELTSINVINLKLHGLSSPFENLSTLEEIYLDRNHLNEFPRELFRGIPHLTTIAVFNQEIRNLSRDSFSEVGDNLQSLQLHKNQIEYIEPGTFDGLTHLDELNLEFNLLSSLPDGIFSDLKSLEALLLNGNSITSDFFSLTKGLQNLWHWSLEYSRKSNGSDTFIEGVTCRAALPMKKEGLHLCDIRFQHSSGNQETKWDEVSSSGHIRSKDDLARLVDSARFQQQKQHKQSVIPLE